MHTLRHLVKHWSPCGQRLSSSTTTTIQQGQRIRTVGKTFPKHWRRFFRTSKMPCCLNWHLNRDCKRLRAFWLRHADTVRPCFQQAYKTDSSQGFSSTRLSLWQPNWYVSLTPVDGHLRPALIQKMTCRSGKGLKNKRQRQKPSCNLLARSGKPMMLIYPQFLSHTVSSRGSSNGDPMSIGCRHCHGVLLSVR